MADRQTARFVADLAGQAPWIAEDIAKNLPRAAPESAIEAMLMARRNVAMNPKRHPLFEDDVRLLPHEWDAMEAERYGKGGLQYVRNPRSERLVPNEYGDVPTDIYGNVSLPPKKRARQYFPKPKPQPYPYDAGDVRMERRAHAAEGILEQARQNPEVYDQLPAIFKLPIEDRLIARLAAEGPSAYMPVAREIIDPKVAAARKFLSEHPELLGAGIGTGGTLAYGLMSEE
jgi:hypothetical protein